MSKTIVILNPIAGRGVGERLSPQIVEWLRAHGLEFDLVATAAPGHATLLARDAVEQGHKTVIAVGGDGTANEVLNGLMQVLDDSGDMTMGILPIGTGNDFAFGAGVPLDVQEACNVIVRGRKRILDVGWVQADGAEPRYFGNGMGVGFDAIANIESRKVKRLKGFLVYLVAVIRTLAFYYHAPRTTIRIDSESLIQPCLMISIMNGRRMGGGFYMTPDSQMDDGLLDLCVAAKVSRLKMVRFVPRFMRGTHTTDPDVTMTRGRKVTVISDSPWAAHVDGEIYGVGASRFDTELLPQRLSLLC